MKFMGVNWEMLGHEWAVRLLKEHIARERLRHAYLVTGPQGVGRRTLALRFAQALNCPRPVEPGEPCLACRTCVQISNMQHPDLSILQAEQRGGVLKVEPVRELQHTLSLAPYQARYRVALLLNFENANQSAANALLKTLEEPPPQVVLVLTAESAESLLPTVVSRCEVLRLRTLPVEQVSQALVERWSLPTEQAELLAHLSAGRPGHALSLHRNPDQLEIRQAWLDDLSKLLKMNRAGRFAYADAMSKDKETLQDHLVTWISFWRDVMLCTAGADAPYVNQDRKEEIERFGEEIGLQAACTALACCQRTLDYLTTNVNSRLATEVLMLDLPGVA